jgi:hypothetical protein
VSIVAKNIGNNNGKSANYLTARQVHAISRKNRQITREMEKRNNRKNVPESEYITNKHDYSNVVEFDNLHTYFFTDAGTVKASMASVFNIPAGKTRRRLSVNQLRQISDEPVADENPAAPARPDCRRRDPHQHGL